MNTHPEPLTAPALADLADNFTGPLLQPGSTGYGEACRLHNGAVDARPPLIAQASDTADVAAAVRFAAGQGLEISVRGGGHGVTGRALAGDLVIDLTRMRRTQVDRGLAVTRAGGGATWGDVDAANERSGVATPGGRVTHTGVGGLTLGGGQGWLSSKHGLSADNLSGVELVTAAGDVLRVTDDTDPDLMWALRGGGGNFGVATSFDLRVHEFGHNVLAGGVCYPMDRALEVAAHYQDFLAHAPDEVSGSLYLPGPPAAPLVPPELHHRPVAVVLLIWVGEDLGEGARVLGPMRRIGTPLADQVRPMPYPELQAILDPANIPGRRTYTSTAFLPQLSPDMVTAFLEETLRAPSTHSYCAFTRLGNAVNRVASDATAFSHREARWMCYLDAMWDDPLDDIRNRDWIHASGAVIERFAGAGKYLNINPDLGSETIRQAFGEPTYTRLAGVKRKWDPDNLFHHNANILPEGY